MNVVDELTLVVRLLGADLGREQVWLRLALVRSLPDLSVIAYQEIPIDFGLQPAALVRPEDVQV